MRWKTGKHFKKSRTFLILPLVKKTSTKNDNSIIVMPKKNPTLKLFTKTWPTKKKSTKMNDKINSNDTNKRPLTATLEKPTILNINLIGKIDMSVIRKEFLNFSSLCRLPLVLTKSYKKKLPITRPLSLPISASVDLNKPVKIKRSETSEDSWEDDEINIKLTKKLATKASLKICKNATNNNKYKLSRKRLTNNTNNNNNNNNNKHMTVNISKSIKLPEPCKTCGRPDQPERFHSHPITSLVKPLKKSQYTPKLPTVKSSVQKPVAIKYKSKQIVEKKGCPLAITRKPSLPTQKLIHSPPTMRRLSGKRTLTCYICGREFGTASLPIHEPKCLQKWELENLKLPINLQRPAPIKPDKSLTSEEWNQKAWEASQSSLVACLNCGRTFFPDRLVVHQRSCKNLSNNNNNNNNNNTNKSRLGGSSIVKSTSPMRMSPPSVQCNICSKLFGTHSIKIHEKQCLKKWQFENNGKTPPTSSSSSSDYYTKKNITKETEKNESVGSSSTIVPVNDSGHVRSPMFPCYICGRLFNVETIYNHEPHCLKIWKSENDKLPPYKRKPQPLKPDIKFTSSGEVDFKGTFNRIWENHLAELVACRKCNRKFFPDRIEKHEQACAGLKIPHLQFCMNQV